MTLAVEHLRYLETQLNTLERDDLLELMALECERKITQCLEQAIKHEHQFIAYQLPNVVEVAGRLVMNFNIKSFTHQSYFDMWDLTSPTVHLISL